MRTALTFTLALGLLTCPACADTIGSAVTLEIRTDRGSLPLYPVAGSQGRRAYAEAVKGAGYRLVLRNNLDCRVGVVIAVDGRNIVSGAKSWLKNDERMYILGPHESQEYSGWRTGQDKVNRFYFTTVEDSYAGAFGDTSAMGVVAMAAYPEYFPPPPPRISGRGSQDREEAPGMMFREKAKAAKRFAAEAPSAPGTGYGEEVYAPSITVEFQPEAQPREKTFIKYEWREALVRLGVIRDRPVPGNRLWDSGFAPPPPRL